MRAETDDSITIYPDHLCVVHIRSPFTDGYAVMYKNLLKRMFDRYHVCIDMSEMPDIDGKGVSALLRLHKEAGEYGRKFFIVGPNPAVRKTLDLAMISCLVPTKIDLHDIRMSLAGEEPIMTSSLKEVLGS